MPIAQSTTIQTKFRQLLSFWGASSDEPIRETIVLRNGYYCGRKFVFAGHTLIWFLEEDQIKLFDSRGDLVMSTSTQAFLSFEERKVA